MLVFPATVSHNNASACAALLKQSLPTAAQTTVKLDLSALQQFDSAALSVLLDLRRETLARGQDLVATGFPAKLQSLADVYGLSELFAVAAP